MSKEAIYDDGFNGACWDYAHDQVVPTLERPKDARAPKLASLKPFWTSGYADGLIEAKRRKESSG